MGRVQINKNEAEETPTEIFSVRLTSGSSPD